MRCSASFFSFGGRPNLDAFGGPPSLLKRRAPVAGGDQTAGLPGQDVRLQHQHNPPREVAFLCTFDMKKGLSQAAGFSDTPVQPLGVAFPMLRRLGAL